MASQAPEIASLSDVGVARTVNQDRCAEFVRTSGEHLLVVADGMGGHRGGEIASGVAVEAIGEVFESSSAPPEKMLLEAVREANRRVLSAADRDSALLGMGTTAVLAYLGTDGAVVVAHIGDSRAYRYAARGGEFEAVTEDHSVVAEMQRRGLLTAEQALVHPRRNEILRSIGAGLEVEAEVRAVSAEAGDLIVLCTDGLCGVLRDGEIADVLASQSPDKAVRTLVDRVNAAGGPDNVTVQIARLPTGVSEGSRPPRPRTAGPRATPAPKRGASPWLWLAAALVAGLLALLALGWI